MLRVILILTIECSEVKHMRRYNVYISMGLYGRYELVKEKMESYDFLDDYWEECFTWEDLKKVIPFFRSRGWRVTVEPVNIADALSKVHLPGLTYNIDDNDLNIVDIDDIRVIMVRDLGKRENNKNNSIP